MTPPTAPERCPTCDRPVATKAHWAERDSRGGRSGVAVRNAMRDIEKRDGVCMVTGWIHGCAKHAAPWRARAIAAEARIATVAAEIEHDVGVKRSHDHGRATGGQTCGTGGPLTGAPQSMLRYLDRVVRDLHDERTRAIADHAAQWAKVAPLIERLRAECGAAPFRGRVPSLIECAAALIAAAEATP